MISEVDKQYAAMIADPVNPAGQAGRFTGVAGAQFAACVAPIAMHDNAASFRRIRRVDFAAEKHRTHKLCQGQSGSNLLWAKKFSNATAIVSLVCRADRAYETKAIDMESPA